MARKRRPTLQLFCLCDDIGRVEGSAKLILVGVFERIQVEGIPAQHPKMWVFGRWTGGAGSFTCRTAIVDPDGQVVFETEEIAFTLDAPEQSHNVSGQLVGFPLETDGTFWVEAYLDGELVARIPLVVEQTSYDDGDEEPPPVLH